MNTMTAEQINKKIETITNGETSYISGYKGRYSKIKCYCNVHKYEFEIIFDTIIHWMSKKCSCPECKRIRLAKKKLPRQKVTCDYCGKEFEKIHLNDKFNFCCRECKDRAQRLDSGEKFESLRPEHYNNGLYAYRVKAFREYPHECAICGWNEDIDVLEVHHIDSNRLNNSLDNLIILCPNCHRKLTLGTYYLDKNDKKIIKK